jgi:hypothetical protein
MKEALGKIEAFEKMGDFVILVFMIIKVKL